MRIVFAIALLGGLCVQTLDAQPVIVLDSLHDRFDIGHHLWLYEDRFGTLTIDSVCADEYANKFVMSQNSRLILAIPVPCIGRDSMSSADNRRCRIGIWNMRIQCLTASVSTFQIH